MFAGRGLFERDAHVTDYLFHGFLSHAQ
jgi:hypothetical protein